MEGLEKVRSSGVGKWGVDGVNENGEYLVVIVQKEGCCEQTPS